MPNRGGSGGERSSSSSSGSSSRRRCGVRLPRQAPRRCPRPIPRPRRKAPRPPPTPLRARVRLRATSPRPRKPRVAPTLRPPTSRRRPTRRSPRSYPFRARHRFPPRRTRACPTDGVSTIPPRVRRMLVNADGRKHQGPHRSWKGWEPDPRWGTYGTATLDVAAAKLQARGWTEERIGANDLCAVHRGRAGDLVGYVGRAAVRGWLSPASRAGCVVSLRCADPRGGQGVPPVRRRSPRRPHGLDRP